MTSKINTYNESNLHNTLKTMYAINNDGKTEVKKNGYIYDVVTKNDEIFEIQTANLSKLLPKILTTLKNGLKITVVYPLIITKTIYLYDTDGKLIYKRKSPKKGNIYNLFDELTGIYPALLNKNFTLEVLEITMKEERIRTPEPVQAKNNKRHFKRNWYKNNKKLEDILSTKKYNNANDYLSLLPTNLPAEFCAKDLKTLFSTNKAYPKDVQKKSNLIIWVFSHMELISFTQIKNRNHYYKISNCFQSKKN